MYWAFAQEPEDIKQCPPKWDVTFGLTIRYQKSWTTVRKQIINPKWPRFYHQMSNCKLLDSSKFKIYFCGWYCWTKGDNHSRDNNEEGHGSPFSSPIPSGILVSFAMLPYPVTGRAGLLPHLIFFYCFWFFYHP